MAGQQPENGLGGRRHILLEWGQPATKLLPPTVLLAGLMLSVPYPRDLEGTSHARVFAFVFLEQLLLLLLLLLLLSRLLLLYAAGNWLKRTPPRTIL